mgnify:CR=1 FL=1
MDRKRFSYAIPFPRAAASTKKKHRPLPLLWLLLVLVVAVGADRLFTGYFPFQPRQSLDGQTISRETLSQLRELAKEETQAKYILKNLEDYPPACFPCLPATQRPWTLWLATPSTNMTPPPTQWAR